MSIETPSSSQLMVGLGLPLAAQSKVTFIPSVATVDLGVAINSGAMVRLAPSTR